MGNGATKLLPRLQLLVAELHFFVFFLIEQ